MGCGVSKAPSPTPNVEETDNLSEPKDTPKDVVSPIPIANSPQVHARGELISPRSATPKSTDTGGRSTSSTTDEGSQANSPLRIKANLDEGTSVNSNTPAVETKKGFVAFDIPLNDSQEATLDNLLKKPLPRRLRHLEPLGNAPQITSEMLMEKLEKAEEKRQKALARWKEQAAKRREMALRRSEQMGDTILSTQHTKADEDEESMKLEKESEVKETDDGQNLEVPCDENTNWNVKKEDEDASLEQPSPDEQSEESTNQNNNNLVMSNLMPESVQCDKNTHSSDSERCLLALPQDDPIKRCLSRHPPLRGGCYLQAVQEESEESEDSEAAEDTEKNSSLSNQQTNNSQVRSTLGHLGKRLNRINRSRTNGF